MGDSPYLHGAIKKSEAEALLEADGGLEETGKFLVRLKGGEQNLAFILSVVYKGKATHHNLNRADEGDEFTINKQPTGCTTLAKAISFLGEKQKAAKWPLALTTGVEAPGKSGASSAAGAAKEGGSDDGDGPDRGAGGASSGNGPFFHGPIKKSACEDLLLADNGTDVKGKFLVRSKGDSDTNFILSVIYKGQPSHHMLVREAVGDEFTLNKVPTGCDNISDVIEKYRSKQPKWPVPLTDGVPNGSDDGGGGDGGAEDANEPTKAEPAVPAATKPTQAPPASGDTAAVSPDGPYCHGAIKKSQCDELLLADAGADVKGKFLVRTKGASDTNYILSVIYKGNPTHHNLVRAAVGEEFALNKVPTGCTTIPEVLEKYRSKQPKWPVPLTEGVPNGDASPATASVAAPSQPDEPSAAPPKKTPQADSKPSTNASSKKKKKAESPDGPFSHAPMKKEKCEELLLADGGAKVKGKFLVRAKDKSGLKFILSVIYKGAPTHHNLIRGGVGEEFKLNKNGTGCTSIPDVLEKYRTKQPKWPVPLTEGVSNGEDAADDEGGDNGGGGDGQAANPDVGGAASDAGQPQPKEPASIAIEVEDPMTEWFHGQLPKDKAEALLLADNGKKVTGKFLVRSKKPGHDNLILSVIFKGKPGHHALIRKAEDQPYSINKKDTGLQTVSAVIEWLRAKRPKWPVPLTDGVSNGKPKVAVVRKATPPPPAEPPVAAVHDSTGSASEHGQVYPESDDDDTAANEPDVVLVTRHEVAAKTAQWPPRRKLSAELDVDRQRVVPTRETIKVEISANNTAEAQQAKLDRLAAGATSNLSAFAGFEDLYTPPAGAADATPKAAPPRRGSLLTGELFKGFDALTTVAKTDEDDDSSGDEFGFSSP